MILRTYIDRPPKIFAGRANVDIKLSPDLVMVNFGGASIFSMFATMSSRVVVLPHRHAKE